MSRTFWLVSDGSKRTASPTATARQQFRAGAIEVEMFSVGEGEAILISRGSNVVMVDGGSGPLKPTNDELATLLAGWIPSADCGPSSRRTPPGSHQRAPRLRRPVCGSGGSERRVLRQRNLSIDPMVQRTPCWSPWPSVSRRPIDDDPTTDGNPEIPGLGAVFHHLRSTTGASSEAGQVYWSVFTVMRFNLMW